MWLKVSRSSFQHTQASLACTEAARGALYKSASSPNASPASHVLTTTSEPSFMIKQSNAPDSITNMKSPLSPCLITRSPFWKICSSTASKMMLASESPRVAKRKFFVRTSLMRPRCSSDFGWRGGVNFFFFLGLLVLRRIPHLPDVVNSLRRHLLQLRLHKLDLSLEQRVLLVDRIDVDVRFPRLLLEGLDHELQRLVRHLRQHAADQLLEKWVDLLADVFLLGLRQVHAIKICAGGHGRRKVLSASV